MVDPDALHAARNALRRHLAEQLEGEFAGLYTTLEVTEPYTPSSEQAGRRALRNLCLGYLLELDTPAIRDLALRQFRAALTLASAASAATRSRPGRIPCGRAGSWPNGPMRL